MASWLGLFNIFFPYTSTFRKGKKVTLAFDRESVVKEEKLLRAWGKPFGLRYLGYCNSAVMGDGFSLKAQ